MWRQREWERFQSHKVTFQSFEKPTKCGTDSACTEGQPAAATTLGGGTTFRGHHEASRGRGRGRGGYAAKRNGSGGFARGSQDTTSRLLSSTSTKALQTRGCSAHFNSQARNGPNKGTAGVASADPSASSLKFQTYEEWEADKVRRGRKQEEEETARLLEENERAMYIDLPTDTESLPSQSISTGAASEPPRSLPRYMVLEPMRKTPASVASSSGVSSTKLVSSSSALPATKEVVESTKIPPQGTPELDQPFFVGIGNKHQEIKDPVPVIPAPSGFRAPDWRARGKTEPQPCWSDAGSEMAASENELRGETNSGKAENVDKITAEWDRVLLGSD